MDEVVTYELLASLKPFSIAGIKFEGIAWPIIIFSNSNFVGDPIGRGSIYLQNIKERAGKHLKATHTTFEDEIFLRHQLQAW